MFAYRELTKMLTVDFRKATDGISQQGLWCVFVSKSSVLTAIGVCLCVEATLSNFWYHGACCLTGWFDGLGTGGCLSCLQVTPALCNLAVGQPHP